MSMSVIIYENEISSNYSLYVNEMNTHLLDCIYYDLERLYTTWSNNDNWREKCHIKCNLNRQSCSDNTSSCTLLELPRMSRDKPPRKNNITCANTYIKRHFKPFACPLSQGFRCAYYLRTSLQECENR